MRTQIRFRTTIAAIAVVILLNLLFSVVGIYYLGNLWFGEVQTRVRMDLYSARAAYLEHQNDLLRYLQIAASEPQPAATFDRIAARLPMDRLMLLDPRGTVVDSPGDLAVGRSLAGDPLVSRVLRTREAAQGTLILSAEHLAAMFPDRSAALAGDVFPPSEQGGRRGMVIAAVVPLLGERSELTGLLYGADLLNGRFELVDTIRDQVFSQDVLNGEKIGTVTLFQDRWRIATNVPDARGGRAVGTQISDEVAERVLHEGLPWDGPAVVVDRRFITSYEPIRDPDGNIIGALYVGLPETPFARRRNVVTFGFLGIVLLTSLIGLGVLYYVVHWVLQPVYRIGRMTQQIVAGDITARVGIRPPGELGELCVAVDQIAETLARREEKLKMLTDRQIGQSEKLAAIGRLAAGVAHEINNPLTGVLTFAHLLRERPGLDRQAEQDIDLIIHEADRAVEIIRGLLEFARERHPVVQPVSLNELVDRVVQLIRTQKDFSQIEIVRRPDDRLPTLRGDRNQLQQVLLNLALNACQAMPEGGTLTIETHSGDNEVRLRMIDTGVGILPEHLDRIFDPFFSTQPVGKGTGLGLSVSYGIVRSHGGKLEVESRPGQGAAFTVTLPLDPPEGLLPPETEPTGGP